MKKFLFIILPLFLFDIVLAKSSFAAAPTPVPTSSTSVPIQPGPNPGPPIGTPCGNTMCLENEICVQYPGDVDQHCVPADFDPDKPEDVGKNLPPECAGNNGVFPPNSTCWNKFKNTQKELSFYDKTCIYEPVVTYSSTRYLHGSDDEQPYDMCGIGECGPNCPVSAPGGGNFDCTVAMLVYTDVRDAELGSYGPSTKAESENSVDFLAQNYLYNALFGRPMDLSNKNREAYRTYWRLLSASNQANLRSFILNMAHDELILNIKFNYTDSLGVKKEIDFNTLYNALSQQVILFLHFPFVRIGCLTSYPVCPEFAQAIKELRPGSQEILQTILDFNIAGVSQAIQTYDFVKSSFGGDLGSPYDAFVPLDFSSTRGYILKKKDGLEEELYAKYDRWLKDVFNQPRYGTNKPNLTNISRENLPYIGAIYDGLLSPKFGLITSLQPSWLTASIAAEKVTTDYKMGNKPEDFPEVKIAHRNFLEAIKEEAEAIISNPLGWISSTVRSFFTPEDKKFGYTDNNKDNTNEEIRQEYLDMKGCPLPLSYHLVSPYTVARSIDDHHQVVSIPGNQLSWSYTPDHRPLYKYSCVKVREPKTHRIIETDCGLHYIPCPDDDEHYELGSQCYTRKWSVSGIKHGKALTVLNNPKQTDIKEMVADNNKYSFYKMMLPSGANKITDASIDAPLAKNFSSFLDKGKSTTATGPNGSSKVLNPAEPINRVNNLAQDTMHILQNCWVVPGDLQSSPRCDYAFPPEATVSACTGEAFKKIFGGGNPDKPSAAGENYFNSFIKSKLTGEVMEAYAEAEKETGVPCEVLAGIHFKEGDNNPDQDLQSGAPLGGRSLTESAVQAAKELKQKAGGDITSLNQLIKALSYYNGGGNSNCQTGGSHACSAATTDRCGSTVACTTDVSACKCTSQGFEPGSCRAQCGLGFPYQFSYPYCPPASTGYDDPYVTNFWKSPVHDKMYILYMYDCTQTKPYVDSRPGTLTVAISLFLTETPSTMSPLQSQ